MTSGRDPLRGGHYAAKQIHRSDRLAFCMEVLEHVVDASPLLEGCGGVLRVSLVARRRAAGGER
jgi:hypothetical protein